MPKSGGALVALLGSCISFGDFLRMTSLSTSALDHVEPLITHKYHTWKPRMETIIKWKGLWALTSSE